MDNSEKITPSNIIIVEGIMVLAIPIIRELLDIKVYVETPDDIRFIRRLERDIETGKKRPIRHQAILIDRPSNAYHFCGTVEGFRQYHYPGRRLKRGCHRRLGGSHPTASPKRSKRIIICCFSFQAKRLEVFCLKQKSSWVLHVLENQFI